MFFRFREDNNDHLIVANLGDSVDFICPYYDPNDRSVSPEDYEYYYIYNVSFTIYIVYTSSLLTY